MGLLALRVAGYFSAAVVFVGCGGSAFSSGGADGGGAGEAGAVVGDGAADGAEACASYCASKTGLSFCADFDEQAAGQAPTGWAVAATAGGSAMISQAQALSCSGSLAASLPAESHTGGTAGISTAVAVKGGAPRVVVDLAVYLPTQDTQSYVTYLAMAAGLEGAIGLTHHADAFWFVTSKDGTINVELTPAPLVGAWNQMNFDIQYAVAGGSVKLTYVGTDMQTHVASFSGKTTALSPQMVAVSLGLYAPGQTEAPFTAYFDNVEIKAE